MEEGISEIGSQLRGGGGGGGEGEGIREEEEWGRRRR